MASHSGVPKSYFPGEHSFTYQALTQIQSDDFEHFSISERWQNGARSQVPVNDPKPPFVLTNTDFELNCQ
jgi:hypothetical protein